MGEPRIWSANDANFRELNRKFSFGKRNRLLGGAKRNRNVYRLHFFFGLKLACLVVILLLFVPFVGVSV